MTSNINASMPSEGLATTQSVRDNFVTAKQEIEALQMASTSSVAITGGSINGTTVGAITPAAGTFTTLTSTGNAALGDNEVTDTHAIKGATTILSNSASPALTVTNTGSGNSFVVEDAASTDSTPFVINSGGQVTVGHTSQPYFVSGVAPNFGVIGTTNNQSSICAAMYSEDTSPSRLLLGKSRGAIGVESAVLSGDLLGSVLFSGSDGTIQTVAAQITCACDGTPGTNDMPGRLMLYTTADGASSPTERMRIDKAGNVGIGTASNSAIRMYCYLNSSQASTTEYAGYFQTNAANATGAATKFGLQGSAFSAAGVAANSYYGVQGDAVQGAAVTTNVLIGVGGRAYASAAGTITGAYGFTASILNSGGATITNAIGYNCPDIAVGTNSYGYYSAISSGSGKWNFYAAGTASSYFGGLVDISGASAGQIKFPAAQNASADANTLDDYEEGTFTPVVKDAAAGNAATASTSTGTYTKIGNVVNFSILFIDINTTGLTAGNQVYITGLPFIMTSSNPYPCRLASCTPTTGAVFATGSGSQSYLSLENATTTGIAIFTVSQITSGAGDIRLSGHFIV